MAPGRKRPLPAHVQPQAAREIHSPIPAPIVGPNGAASSSSKKVRGKSIGLATEQAYRANNDKPLPVIIPKEVNAPIGRHATKFANTLGTLIRHMAPLEGVTVWTEIDDSMKEVVIAAARNKFEIVGYDDASEGHVKEVVHSKCYQLYKGWRSRMKTHYMELLKGGYDPYKFPYQKMCPIKWKYMIDNVWSSEEHQKIAAKNKVNKSKQLYSHTMGSKSFVVAMSEEPEDDTFGKFYEKSRKYKDTDIWIHPICEERHAEMIELEKKSQEDGTPLSKEEVSQQVLGKKSSYLRGFGVGPKPRSSFSNSSQSQARDDEVKLLNEELAMLREKTSSQEAQISSQAIQINELYGMIQAIGTHRSATNSSNANQDGFMNLLMNN